MNLKRPNMDLKRPSLKLTRGGADVKMPKFMADLVSDLREKRLLPLVAVFLLAIVAVPFVLSSSAPEPDAAAPAGSAAAVPANEVEVPPQAQFTAVEAQPTLRDYRDRLRSLAPQNPFKQQFTAPDLAGSQLNEPVPTSGSSVTVGGGDLPDVGSSGVSSVPLPSLPGSGGSGSGGSGGGGQTGVAVRTQYVRYIVDVRIASGGKARVRPDVPEQTMLPSKKNPIALFMGMSGDRKKALFAVSPRVESIFGDAKCLLGGETCQLLAVEPGLPVTFVLENGRSYTLKLLEVNTRSSSRP